MKVEQEIYREWVRTIESFRQSLRGGQGVSVLTESKEAQAKRIARARRDYPFFVRTYFPHIARCKCGRFQTGAARYILEHPRARAVFEWARGHAKSTHMGVLVPLWLKIQEKRQFNVMVLVSKSEDSAVKLLADLQQELAFNDLYIHDFGQQMKEGNWAEGEFTTSDGCYFTALGRGQSPRGLKDKSRRPDYIVVDDIDDDEMARNEKRTRLAAEWVLSALFGTMEAGRGRFIMVGNRIAKKSILTMVAERPGVHHTVVNILDRSGNPTWSENYTPSEVAEMRSMMGERNFQKEYMNNPMTEGAVFRPEQITYGRMLPLKEYKMLVCYTDPSFKNSSTADYKATMLVGRTPDGHFHLLKAFAAQASVSDMIRWHYEVNDFVGGAVPVMYYMESNFMQDLVKAILESEYYGYSVVELSADRSGAQKMELLPRRNFNPADGRFYPDATGDRFIEYRELHEYGRFVLEFYSQHIGLLNKAVPHVLFKKFAQSCWSELCEIYGIPPRYIKTNTNDESMLSRAESMLRDMGAAAAFVIDSEEEFSFAQGTATNGDVYNNLIRLCNNENSLLISGAIIGQDTANGNYSKEQASIGILDRLIDSDRRMVEVYMNSQVIPALVRIGWLPAAAQGLRFRFSTADDPEKLWKMVTGLLPYKDIDNGWLAEKFGIPVGDKQFGAASMTARLEEHITRGDPYFFQ